MDRHQKALEIIAKGTVIPATPLVLDKERKLNEKGLRLLMNYYLNCGVGGVATAVHTTQFEIRDPKFGLYEPVLKIVSDEIDKFEAKNNTVVAKVAGVCGLTEQAVAEAELAKKYGFDAVLLSPNGLLDVSEEYLIERTKKVAEVMPVIGFYLQTAATGRKFTYSYWEKLCAIDNVIAIKAAPFNRYMTLDVVRAAALSERSNEITLYTGNDDNIVIDLLTTYKFTKDGKTYEKSFQGGLLGHWSVWTKKAVEIHQRTQEAKKSGNIPAELLTLAAEVTDTNAIFFDTANNFKGSTPCLHYVLHNQGLMEDTLLLNPERKMSPGQAEEVARLYEYYPHLNDDAFIKENIDTWKKEIE